MSKMRLLFVLLVTFCFIKGAEIDVKRCNCYMLGTFETPDGKSLCEVSTGKCSCLKNVVGINCDKCRDGYFGLLSGQGCKFCRCNMVGSLKQECNDIDGKCSCKRGYTGHKCEKCMNENPIINRKCCECPKISSLSKICDSNGTCKCKPNTSGDKCDKCDENYYYNNKTGCTPCNKCYNILKEATETYEEKLQSTIAALNANNITTLSTEYKKFENSIKSLTQKIAKLNADEIKVINKDLFVSIKKVLNDLDSLEENIKKTLDERAKVVAKVNSIEGKYNKTKSLLKSGMKLIKSENVLIEKLKTLVLKAELIKKGIDSRTIKTEELSKVVKDMERLKNETEIALQTNTADLTDLNKEIDKLKNLIKDIKSTKNEINENHTKATELNGTLSNLEIKGNNIKISADLDFVRKVGDTVGKFKFPTVDFDVEKLRGKMDKIEKYVDYIEDVKRKNLEVIDEFMKIQTHFNMQEILLNIDEVNKAIQKLMKEYKGINNKIETEIKPNLTQIEEGLLKFDNFDRNLIREISNELNKQQRNLDKTIKDQEDVLSKFQGDNEIYEKLLVMNPLFEFEEKMAEIELVLKDFPTFEKEIKDAILMYEDFITFLKGIPLYNDELDQVELEIETLESYYDNYEYLLKFKLQLEKEVEDVEKILAGLPEEKTWCNAPKTIT